MSNRAHLQNAKSRRQQNGAALLVILLIVLASGVYAFLNYNSATNTSIERDRITTAALAQAKEALIGYASSRDLSGADRPGDLPCPDTNDDGIAENGCGNASGTTGQTLRLGRLPWKTLGLPDLRDGSGERLWYVVSSNFKENTRYFPLNSDTPGTISLRDSNGALTQDATVGNGAIAVIIAAGAPLTRPTSVSNTTPYTQNRDTAGSLLPINYLDLAWGEDNADFAEVSTNGLINGPVRDTNGNIISNDRLLWITPSQLMPILEKRVVAEVTSCLNAYAGNATNAGRLPWMAPNAPSSYADATNTSFGRLPDSANFIATCSSSGGTWSSSTCAGGMTSTWSACSISSLSGWWLNWKELVFVSVAQNHLPSPTPPTNLCGVSGFSSASVCTNVDGATNKQFAVIIAGKTIAGQVRPSSSPSNYLENTNATPALNRFVSTAAAPFNDVLKSSP